MRAWFATDAEGRVNSSTTVEEYTNDSFTEVEVEDGFDFAKQGDPRLVAGALVPAGPPPAAAAAARREAAAAAERRATIDAGAAEYFADGGRERMQAEIDTSQSTANEAKTTADASAASMNEYLDALLGLDATDETEATDAE